MRTCDFPTPWPYTNRTYKLSAELVERLEGAAAARCLYPSDLVRFLLAYGLDQVASGALVIPTRPLVCVIDAGGEERESPVDQCR